MKIKLDQKRNSPSNNTSWRRPIKIAKMVRPMPFSKFAALSIVSAAVFFLPHAWAAPCAATGGSNKCERITFSGADQSFAVPPGVSSLRVEAWGAGGGGLKSGYYNGTGMRTGGGGGYASAALTVAPGNVLGVMVGRAGAVNSTNATYGGGGGGGLGTSNGQNTTGGSGGGLSALWAGATLSPASAFLVSGGGGGASPGADTSSSYAGAGGGSNGGQSGNPSIDGRGGTQVGGGSSATDTTPACAGMSAGGQFVGGQGGAYAGGGNNEGGGGGGGGWFGGGGGRCQSQTVLNVSNGAGGGGSSYIASLAVVTAGVTTAGAQDTADGNNGGAPNASGGTASDQYVPGIGEGGVDTSGDGMVVIQYTMSAPTCTASPNPSNRSTSTVITCVGNYAPGETVSIPGTTCTAPSGGSSTCTSTSNTSVAANPTATVSDGVNARTAPVAYTVDTTPPTAPVCTASPSNAGGNSVVTIACTVEAGTTNTIPGATCTPNPASGTTSISCTGQASGIASNPTATSRDAAGNTSTATVAFTQTTANANPVCTASPNPSNRTGNTVITCTNIASGNTVAVPGTSCVPSPSNGGNVVCTSTSPSSVAANPTATVTTPGNLASSATVPYTVDTTPPVAPVCTASPPNAVGATVVTIACTVEAGSTNTIPGTTCTPNPATGTSISCTGPASGIASNPGVTSTDTAGNVSTAVVAFLAAGLQVTSVPALSPLALAALALLLALWSAHQRGYRIRLRH